MVVADVFVSVFSLPIVMTMYSAIGRIEHPITSWRDALDYLLGFAVLMAMMLPGAVNVWLFALALSYTIVRVRRAVEASDQG